MLKNPNGIPDENKQKAEEICSEMRELNDGLKSSDEFAKEGMLALRLKNLIALGAAIAGQRDHEFVGSCVVECLKAGATRDEIMEVLRQAILMAEVNAGIYTGIVRKAIDAFVG